MKLLQAILLGLALVAAFMPTTQAQKISLEDCQKLKNDIARYDSQRRAGGSGSQMDAWKRARRESERAYSKSACWRYGRKLK